MTTRVEPAGLSTTALVIIDVQMEFAFRTIAGVPRSTPMAEANITSLLDAFRAAAGRVIHVHHHSHESGSPFTAGEPGAEVQAIARPQAGEAVYIKHVNSAFIGTSLEADLRREGVQQIVVCGGTANHCVETTARMAGNLGFDVFYVDDAVWAYGNTGPDGREHSPQDVLSATLSNLHGEFASVVKTGDILQRMPH
ncbi:MAG: isochorismatase family protein [Rhizobiales bacterium]|nr:isochorismatase family protein [Hyphomicrobiales bacterium]